MLIVAVVRLLQMLTISCMRFMQHYMTERYNAALYAKRYTALLGMMVVP